MKDIIGKNLYKTEGKEMTKHVVEFSYKLPEWGTMQMDIDPALDLLEKKEIAIREINDVSPDVEDIEINEMKEI